MVSNVRAAPKAKGVERIYTPGEIECNKHRDAEQNGIDLPPDVESSLAGLAQELGIQLPLLA